MKAATRVAMVGLTLALLALPATLQARPAPGSGQLGQILKRAQQFKDVEISDDEEQQLGQAVSERIRKRYGVVQDPAIHKYVTLLGSVLAQASTRPNLAWRFIVLDTDGVNALAAPGGYIHVTRGALSLMKSEAELAGVLGHEIIHVTEKHTIRAIQKGKLVQMGADETLSGNKALSPNQGACVVFQWVSDTKSCDIIYQTGLSALLGFNEVTSGNGGSTWSSSLTGSLNCAIYGTVTTPDPVAYLYYYTGMRVVLRTSSDSTCRIATTVRMLNEPQVSG